MRKTHLQKQFIALVLMLCFLGVNGWGQTTYSWSGASGGSWTTASNWTPNRTTPATNDILEFSTGTTLSIIDVPTQTIGKLIVSTSNTSISLRSSSAVTLTISGGANALSVNANTTLNLSSIVNANAITINVATGSTGTISGNMAFSASAPATSTAHRLTAADVSGLTFNSGAIFTSQSSQSGPPFGTTGSSNTVIFASGSVFQYRGGGNPFSLTAPSSKVEFQSGSTFRMQTSSAPSISGRTYANFEVDAASFNQNLTYSNTWTINGNLTITQATTCNFNGTGGLVVSGNITRTSGAVSFSPTSAGSLTLNGTGDQTISGAITFNSNLNLIVNKSTGLVNLSNDYIINGGLNLQAGTLSIGSNTLTLAGTVSRTSGVLRGSNSSNIITQGSSAKALDFDQTTDGSHQNPTTGTNSLGNLELQGSGAITLNNKVNLYGILTTATGTTLNSGDGLLVFRNTGSSTARIAPISGSPTFTGAVVVENFINKQSRGWRLLSSPLTSAGSGGTVTGTIQNNWQSDFGFPEVGGFKNYGTNFYSPSGLNGMDGTTVSNSLLRFRADTGTLGGWTNINTTGIEQFNNDAQNASSTSNNPPVFFAFVRGDKSVPPGLAQTFRPTTLAAKGRVTFGSKQVNVTANSMTNGYAAVGNPFISPVDINLASFSATDFASSNTIWVWDPTLGSTQLGGFVALTGANNYTTSGNMTKFLQTGQAFLVRFDVGKSSGSITFEETDKVSNFTTTVTGAGNGLKDILSTKLSIVNTDGSKHLADVHQTIFASGYTNNFNISEDAPKYINGGENLSSKIGSDLLSIDLRSYIQNDDSIFMNFTNTRVANYEFEFDPSNFDATVLDAKLVDKFLNTETPISLSAKTTVPFSVTATIGSNAADRFMIVFRGTGALPNKGFTVTGEKLGTNKVKVNWEAQAETGVKEYALEKSTDGVNYQTVNTQAAKNGNVANSYTYTDNSPVNGINYYRVKTTQHNDIERYSTVITVNFKQQGTNNVTVYPNPVKGNTIGLQLQDLEKGMYSVRILSIEGKEVYKQQLQVNGSSLNTTINPSTKLAQGTYTLQVVGKSTTYTQKVVVE